ncbi:MAG: hypothetical protein FWE43_02945 [Streptococcaceae bacterium]|nr:hypothetical protein [Streptococcaceae bacterium]MCL2681420.1 hypothetical protein [Streptococcaceae bacterium]
MTEKLNHNSIYAFDFKDEDDDDDFMEDRNPCQRCFVGNAMMVGGYCDDCHIIRQQEFIDGRWCSRCGLLLDYDGCHWCMYGEL